MEAHIVVRAEEIHLYLMTQRPPTTVLAAQTLVAPTAPVVAASTTALVGAPVAVAGASTTGLHCTYCQCDCHTYQTCYSRRRSLGRRGGRPQRGSAQSGGVGAPHKPDTAQQMVSLLQRLVVSSTTGSSSAASPATQLLQPLSLLPQVYHIL